MALHETGGAPPASVAGSVADSIASERVLLREPPVNSEGPAFEESSGDEGPIAGRAIDNFLLRDRSKSRDPSEEPPRPHVVTADDDDTQFSTTTVC